MFPVREDAEPPLLAGRQAGQRLVHPGQVGRLRRCSDLLCSGKPFTDHSSFPELVVDHSDPRPTWRQVVGTIREAVTAGQLVAGDRLPSAREIAGQHGVRTSMLQHALAALADEGVIDVRQWPPGHRRPQRFRGRVSGQSLARQAAPRLHAGGLSVTSVPPDEGEDYPEHPLDPLRGVCGCGALGVDRPEPGEAAASTFSPSGIVGTDGGAEVVAAARESDLALALYLWLTAVPAPAAANYVAVRGTWGCVVRRGSGSRQRGTAEGIRQGGNPEPAPYGPDSWFPPHNSLP